MNNTTFGDEGFGYYETVAGGAGAVSCINKRAFCTKQNNMNYCY